MGDSIEYKTTTTIVDATVEHFWTRVRFPTSPKKLKDIMSLLDLDLHGIPATGAYVKRPWQIPTLTPEVLEQLHQEMMEIRKEFSKRVQKMYDIPIEQIYAKSR